MGSSTPNTDCFLCRKVVVLTPTSQEFINWKKLSADSICEALNIHSSPCSSLLAEAKYCLDCYKVLFDIQFLESSIQRLRHRKEALTRVAQEFLLQRYEEVNEHSASDRIAEGIKLIVEDMALQNMDSIIKTEAVEWEVPERGVGEPDLDQNGSNSEFHGNLDSAVHPYDGFQFQTTNLTCQPGSVKAIRRTNRFHGPCCQPNEILHLVYKEPQSNSVKTGVKSTQNGLGERKKYEKFVIGDHIRVLGGARPLYECTICKRTFETKQHITYHERCKTGVDPFRCVECDKGFLSKGGYAYHLMHHNTLRKRGRKSQFILPGHISALQGADGLLWYDCSICKAKFKTKQTIKHHLQTDPTKHPGKRGRKKGSRNGGRKKGSQRIPFPNHISVVQGNPPLYECSICRSQFLRKNTITYHRLCKTGETPFKCGKCGMGFKTKHHLVRHELIRHNKNGAKKHRDGLIRTAKEPPPGHKPTMKKLPELVLCVKRCDANNSKGRAGHLLQGNHYP